jgi:hypothetical protein
MHCHLAAAPGFASSPETGRSRAVGNAHARRGPAAIFFGVWKLGAILLSLSVHMRIGRVLAQERPSRRVLARGARVNIRVSRGAAPGSGH